MYSKQAESLRRQIFDHWKNKVNPNECSASDYDFYRGFRISAPMRPNDYIYTHINIETLREIGIHIWNGAEAGYEKHIKSE